MLDSFGYMLVGMILGAAITGLLQYVAGRIERKNHDA